MVKRTRITRVPIRDSDAPVLRMAASVSGEIMHTIGARKPETGGILLGPVDSDDITNYYFDVGAICSRASYEIDYETLKRKMNEEWIPSGIDMKGLVHSHPEHFDRLSTGDMRFIRRLLTINPDMDVFAAPIVLPGMFTMRPFVVLRKGFVAKQARLELF